MKRFIDVLLTARPGEALLMSGFPLLGTIVAGGESLYRMALFGVLMWMGSMSVFAFNVWGGRDWDTGNTRLSGGLLRESNVPPLYALIWALVLVTTATAGLATFGIHQPILALVIFGIWALYSHPKIHWKSVPFVSSLLHLVGGAVMFALGYSWIGQWDAVGAGTALFVALSFTAGHLNHQIMDHDADRDASLNTTAVHIGPRRTLYLCFTVFAAAYLVLPLMASTGGLPCAYALPFLAAGAIHFALFLRWRHRDPVAFAPVHMRVYRAMYLAAGVTTGAIALWRQG